MIREQYFIMEIGGEPKGHDSIEKLKRKVHRTVLRVDSKAKMDSRTFANLEYRFIWSGRVENIGRIDNMYKDTIKAASENLNKWIFSIKVEYQEKG